LAWQFNQTEPVFLQIAQVLRARIVSGELAPGSLAPTVRQLAADAAVNPNTVQRALTLLEEEGLLRAQSTAGRLITGDEEILRQAREALIRDVAARLVREAHALGLGAKELLAYIEKEEEHYE
jgi:DNA-binding transcriptional regulator YhcF (GntR family)